MEPRNSREKERKINSLFMAKQKRHNHKTTNKTEEFKKTITPNKIIITKCVYLLQTTKKSPTQPLISHVGNPATPHNQQPNPRQLVFCWVEIDKRARKKIKEIQSQMRWFPVTRTSSNTQALVLLVGNPPRLIQHIVERVCTEAQFS